MFKKHYCLIIAIFAFLKLYQFTLLSLVPSQFDLSNVRYQHESFPYSIIYLTISWDNVYFNQLFLTGPRYEHEYVFSPLWCKLMSFIRSLSSNMETDPYIMATAISNGLQLADAFALYNLTKLIFKNGDSRKPLVASIVFLINPLGVFGSVPYSENLCCFFSLVALYLRELSLASNSYPLYIAGSLFTCLAVWTRSNSIVLGLLYFLDFVKFQGPMSRTAFASGFILFLGLLGYNYLPYKKFCTTYDARPWCSSAIPSLFTYIQTERWDNGFLRYWTPKNIPNFLFAVPSLVLLSQSSWKYINNPGLWTLSYMTILFTLLILFFANVQIIVRISSFIPLTHWFLAELILQKKGYIWIIYFFVWISVQTILFGAFLPPA